MSGTTRTSGPESSWLGAVAAAPAVTDAPLGEGARLGPYVLQRRLGRGGMGEVWLGRDEVLDRQVAIKVLQHLAPGQAWLDRFQAEGRALAGLAHPHVVALLHAGTVGSRPFLVMERLHGATWEGMVGVPPGRVARLLRQALAGLAHAHAHGVLHGDVKPSNLWLTDDDLVKVLDFGLARPTGAPGGFAGTPGYMAPEQVRGEALDGRTDVWACGCVGIELLGGVRPDGRAPVGEASIPAHVPAPLAALLHEMVAWRPDDRPTAEQAVERLESHGGSPFAPRSPFRWLEPFGPEDERLFFGRAAETARLRAWLERHPAALVTGASGAGKTSLVRAGLVPVLRREGWRVLERGAPDPRAERRGAEGAGRGLRGAVRALTGAVDAAGVRAWCVSRRERLCVVVDRLEDLVNAPDGLGDPALLPLLEALADDASSPVRVVATLREDCLSAVYRRLDPRGSLAAGVWVLGDGGEHLLRSALEEPAAACGWRLDPALVGHMVSTLAGARAPLPLLQLAASRLYARFGAEPGPTGLAQLASLGGVDGVLAQHAESVLEAFPDPRWVGVAERILRELVSPQRTRRVCARADLLEAGERGYAAAVGEPNGAVVAAEVLARLLAGRLVVAVGPTPSAGAAVLAGSGSESPPPPEGGAREPGALGAAVGIELAHEALIERWERLVGWLAGEAVSRGLRAAVAEAARRWEHAGRDDRLLWVELPAGLGAPAPGSVEAAFRAAVVRRGARGRRVRKVLYGALVGALSALGGVAVYAAVELDARRASAEAAARVAQAEVLLREAGDLLATEPVAALRQGLASADVRPDRRVADLLRAALELPVPVGVLAHEGRVRTLVRAGPWVYSVGEDGRARRWGPAGSAVLEGHTGAVLFLRAAPQGGEVATVSVDGTVRRWKDAVEVARYEAGRPLVDLAWSPAGDWLAAVDDQATVHRWSLDGTRHPPVPTTGRRGCSLAVRPDGAWLAVGAEDGAVHLVPVGEGAAPRRLEAGRGAVYSVGWSPDGQWLLAAADLDRAPALWRGLHGPPRRLQGHDGVVTYAEFSPTGRTIVTGARDFRARLWSLEGEPLAVYAGHQGRVIEARFLPEGEALLTTSDDATARLWRLDGTELAVLRGHDHWVASSAWWPGPEGGPVTGSADGRVWRWSLGAALDAELAGLREQQAMGLLVPFRGAAGPAATPIRPWRGDLGGARGRLAPGYAQPDMITTSPDGAYVASASATDHAVLWSGADGRRLGVLRTPGTAPTVLLLDADRVLAGTADGHVYAWDLGGRLLETSDLGAPVTTLAAHPAGVLVGAADGRVARLGQGPGVSLGEAVSTLIVRDGVAYAGGVGGTVARVLDEEPWRTRLAGEVRSIAASGGQVMAGTSTGALGLWTVRGDPAGVCAGHADQVHEILPAAAGEGWYTSSLDGTVRAWDGGCRERARVSGDGPARLGGWTRDGRLYAVAPEPALWSADLSAHLPLADSAVASDASYLGHGSLAVGHGALLGLDLLGRVLAWSERGEPLLAQRTAFGRQGRAALVPGGVLAVASDLVAQRWGFDPAAVQAAARARLERVAPGAEEAGRRF